MNARGSAAPRPEVAARRLLREASQACLATSVAGDVHAALVTPAFLPDLTPVLLLSGLARHTRHLRENPRCALLCVGATPASDGDLANPQTAPRVSLAAVASPVAPAAHGAVRAHYLARHPYAALYADFTDFGFWRLGIDHAQLVQGFARAFTLGPELLPDAGAVAAVASVSESAIAHCNADHADTMRCVGQAASGVAGAWRLAGIDVDGADLICEAGRARLHWQAPIATAAELQQELIALSRAAREMS